MSASAARWFQEQLEHSAEIVVWALGQIPATRWHRQPPFGGWSPARHLFHLLYYEETLALPSMRQWQGGLLPVPLLSGEELAWRHDHDVEELIAAFHSVRGEQIALLGELSGADWDLPRPTVWGDHSLRWVMTRSYQQTLEHANGLLQMALYWDDALRGRHARA